MKKSATPALLLYHHRICYQSKHLETFIMPKNIPFQQALQLLSFTLLLSGCASEPLPEPTPAPAPTPIISGEQMLQESKGIASLSERWQNGKNMVERGNKMVRDGQNKIDEGNRMIEEGQKIIQESEETYKNIKK